MSVIIFGFWNVPVVRNLINPLKLFTIGWHELCHVTAVSLPCPYRIPIPRLSLAIAVPFPFPCGAVQEPTPSFLVFTCSPQAVLSGGRILKLTIDPHVGGATIVEGGSPWFILSAGYVGSTLLGGAFLIAGWDTLVAKILSFVLGVGLVIPLVLVRDKL